MPTHAPAAHPERFVAYLVDQVVGLTVATVAMLVVVFAALALRPEHAETGISGFLFVGAVLAVAFLAPAFYEAAFLASPWQATPGKRFSKLRVERTDGGRVGLVRGLVRGVAKLVTMWLAYPAAALVFADDRRRAPWDWLVGTRVVSTKGEGREGGG